MASSKLHEKLLRQWDTAARAGLMHTNVNNTRRRCLPGTLGLIVQYNPSHRKKKRPVDPQLLKATTSEPSTTTGFNFTLVKRAEILSALRFQPTDDRTVSSVEMMDIQSVDKDDLNHVLLINVAPLVRGHVLFVFDFNRVKPQKMTKRFLLYALGISHTMHREDFALGFNSTGAWSSVNHFHLQGYFFPPLPGRTSVNFPIATRHRTPLFRIGPTVVSHVPDWKTTCYVIETLNDATSRQSVDIAHTLIDMLQRRGTPHNLLLIHTTLFLFPRQLQCENGAQCFSSGTKGAEPRSTGRLRIAVTELSGLVVARDDIVYDELTEDRFNAILETEVALAPSEEAALTAAWKKRCFEMANDSV